MLDSCRSPPPGRPLPPCSHVEPAAAVQCSRARGFPLGFWDRGSRLRPLPWAAAPYGVPASESGAREEAAAVARGGTAHALTHAEHRVQARARFLGCSGWCQLCWPSRCAAPGLRCRALPRAPRLVHLPRCRIGAGNAVPSHPTGSAEHGVGRRRERGSCRRSRRQRPWLEQTGSQRHPGRCALQSPCHGDRDAVLPRAAVSGAGVAFGHRESKRGGAAAPSHPTTRSQAPLARIAFAMTATAAPALPCGAASAELGLAPCPAGRPGPTLPTATQRCPGDTRPNPLNSARGAAERCSLHLHRSRPWGRGLGVAAGGRGGAV